MIVATPPSAIQIQPLPVRITEAMPQRATAFAARFAMSPQTRPDHGPIRRSSSRWILAITTTRAG